MRLALVIGVLAAALLLAGVIFARGDAERTPVPAIDLRGETTTEVATTAAGEEKSDRRSRTKRKRAAGNSNDGGGGASPAPAPPPVPAGDDDDDDDEPDEDEDERDDDGD